MIYNKTRKVILANTHALCTSFFCQLRGLMFTQKKYNHALVFVFSKPRKVALHMFFVFYPIDVLFLDEKKRVIEIKKNFKPFHVYTSQVKSKYLIELAGSKKLCVKKNDVLSF